MRNQFSLAWWLFILAAMQSATLVLDSHHHLVWGRSGQFLLKTGYLAFSAILFIRYFSFRSQRSFETMVESYNRISVHPWEGVKSPKYSWVNPLLYSLLCMLATADFLLSFYWREAAFRASILVDSGVWMLFLAWTGRVHWLKTLARKERLKEGLDDARSRLSSQIASQESEYRKVAGKLTMLIGLSVLSLFFTLLVSGERWRTSDRVYRLDDLKACLDRCMRTGLDRFYEYGLLAGELSQEPCLRSRQAEIEVSLGLEGGELFLRAVESDSTDYFGNGHAGDEGLALDPGGRFRRIPKHENAK